MARRAKTPRFEEFGILPNCFDFNLGRAYIVAYLGDPPYTLEVGCGRGDFSVELALRYSKCRFVGVDYKSDRMWRGAKTALAEKLTNVAFIRARAEGLPQIFSPGSAEQIWLTFPDPYPKNSDARKRLTHVRYLDVYANLLASSGELLFKTDNHKLFGWSQQQVASSGLFGVERMLLDLHSALNPDDDLAIKTRYEDKFINRGQKIQFLQAKKL